MRKGYRKRNVRTVAIYSTVSTFDSFWDDEVYDNLFKEEGHISKFTLIWLKDGVSEVLRNVHNSAHHNKNLYYNTKFGDHQMAF